MRGLRYIIIGTILVWMGVIVFGYTPPGPDNVNLVLNGSYTSPSHDNIELILEAVGVPTINSVRIDPSTPTSNDDLDGYCNASAGGGSNLTYEWKWYKNGNLNSGGEETRWCYQEETTRSETCGAVARTGSLVQNLGDSSSDTNNWFNFNYTKPENSTSNSLWQVKHGDGAIKNITIPELCWQYDNTSPKDIMFRILTDTNPTGYKSYLYCYDGGWDIISAEGASGAATVDGKANWTLMFDEDWSTYSDTVKTNGDWGHTQLDGAAVAARVYEESMWWEIAISGVTDTCSCPGTNTNWEVSLSDNCNLTDCDLGTGNLTFIDTGFANCRGQINTSNLGDPGSGGTLYIYADCEVKVTS